MVAESVHDALALLRIQHGAGVVVEHDMVSVKRTGILRQRIEGSPQRRPRLAVRGVRVGGGHDVGPGGVDMRVDHERGGVQRPVALDDLALCVHQHHVLDPDLLEVHAQRVDPEVVVPLRVVCGDVPGRAFVEAEMPEQPEGCGEALLAVPPLVIDAVELRNDVGSAVGHHHVIVLLCNAQSNRIGRWTSP